MAVLSRKALLALFAYLLAFNGGIPGVMAATEGASASSAVAATTTSLSTTPASAAFSSTPTSVSDHIHTAYTAPAPTQVPDVSDDMVMAPAITIPVPYPSIQSWSLKPSLHIEWHNNHEHKMNRVTKDSSNYSFNGGKGVPVPAKPAPPAVHKDAWPGAAPAAPGKGPVVHVDQGPDANGYTPPTYNGPVHGIHFPGGHGKRSVSDMIDDDDGTPADAFGGPDDGRFGPKDINPVQHPDSGEKTSSSTVQYKNGWKITTGDSEVDTTSHDDEETGSYTGLGAKEYNKLRTLLDKFTHGKKPPSGSVSAQEQAQAPAQDSVLRQLNATRFANAPIAANATSVRDVVKHLLQESTERSPVLKKILEAVYDELNKTASSNTSIATNTTTPPRGVTKHMLEAPVNGSSGYSSSDYSAIVKHVLEVPDAQLTQANATRAKLARDYVRHMLEAPADRSRVVDIKKILEVLFDQLNQSKTNTSSSSNSTSRAVVKHTLEASVTGAHAYQPATYQPTTLQTVTRPRTALSGVPEDDHQNMRRDDVEGVTHTFHAHQAAKTYTTHSSLVTQDSTSHHETFPYDPAGEHYHEAEEKAEEMYEAMDGSPVFDDPGADDEDNEQTHEDLADLRDETEELGHEIDEEFQDEFGV